MKFQQVLSILRARLRTVLVVLFVVVAASVAINLVLPKTYQATTSLVINYKSTDPVTGNVMPTSQNTGYMATQVDIIQSKTVAMAVVDALHLADAQSVKDDFYAATEGRGNVREWLADLLLRKLKVVPARESNVVEVSFTGNNPEFAAAVANAFAAEYQKAAIQLKVQPLKQASAYFNEQIKDLRDKLEQAQARLSKYQQEKGLVSADNRLDVEQARLNELTSQLVQAQSIVADARSRQGSIDGAAGESPDVIANPYVQSLKTALTQAEASLTQIAQRLDVNHPQYQAAKAEVDKRRAELATQMSITYGSLSHSARIARQRQSEIEGAVAAQKAKILELNRQRDELSVLAREVDGAQRTYDAAINRFAQTSIEGGSNQADVAVLTPALAPLKPSSPKLIMNTLLAVMFGTAFGIGLALLMEIADQRVHTADDMLGLQIPVLTDWRKPKRRFFRLPKFGAGRARPA